MVTIRQSYSCSVDSMHDFLSRFGENQVAAGASTKGSYQNLLLLIEET